MTTPQDSNHLRDLFYGGQFSILLDTLTKIPNPPLEIKVIQLGCLVFLGRTLEVPPLLTEIYRNTATLKGPSGALLCEAKFYEALDLIRRSEYQKGKNCLLENLRLLKQLPLDQSERKSDMDRAAFFVFQGLTFYRFYSGRFKLCHQHALRAFHRAVKIDFKFGMCLALDHIAHTECHLGEVRRGLLHFSEAHSIAEKLENPTLIKALQTSRLVYESQFGVNLKTRESKMRNAIANLNPKDTYSQAELILELSRLLLLKGKCDEAKTLLDERCESIYQHKNRRQSAKFHLRYANVLRFRGELNAASTLLRSAIQNLDPQVDRVFIRQIEGLLQQLRIETEIGDSISQKQLTNFTNDVDRRVSTRTQTRASTAKKKGEDPIGDLVDLAYSGNKNYLIDLIDTGLLGLVPILLGRRPSEKVILFTQKKGALLILSQGNTHYSPTGLSSTMRTLLLTLADGGIHSKGDLVESAWSYRYRSDRHDALLHATIGKLRKIFGKFGSWIQFHGGGFQIAPDIKIASTTESFSAARLPHSQLLTTRAQVSSKERKQPIGAGSTLILNYRQVLALSEFEKGWVVGVADYSRRFEICTMTACRDLGQLLKLGHLQRMGRARATKYRINQKPG